MPIETGTALLSPSAILQALSPDGDVPFIPFLKITAGASVYRFCANTETITRPDGDYIPAPFDVTFAEDTDSAASPVTLTVSMVDRTAADQIMAYQGTVTVLVEVTLATTPHVVEHGGTFVLKSAEYDASTLRAQLGFEESIFMQAFPAKTFNPSSYAGLFL